MSRLYDTLLLEHTPQVGGDIESLLTVSSSVTDDSFSHALRSWGMDPEAIMTIAHEKTSGPSARTSDEILQSWGMDALPSSDIDQLTADIHEMNDQMVLAEAMSQLRSERPWARERQLWLEAQRIADIVFTGGEYPNELGFRTEPDIEIPRPDSIKDRTQGLLQRMSRALTGTRPIATLQYYAGKTHAWFNNLPGKYKLAAGGIGITAVALATEVVALDTAAELGSQLEADLTAMLMPRS